MILLGKRTILSCKPCHFWVIKTYCKTHYVVIILKKYIQLQSMNIFTLNIMRVPLGPLRSAYL